MSLKLFFRKEALLVMILAGLLIFLTLPAGAVLKIGILPDADSIPLLVAREEGLFSDEIEIISFHNPIERDSALQAGAIDGAISDVLAVAFALDNGLGVKITSITNGRYALMVAGSSTIDEYQDLKGVEIAISSNTIIEYTVDRMLKKQGFSDQEIAKIAIPKIPIRLQMLEAGKIKGACLPEPLASVSEKSGARRLGSSEELGEAPGILLFTTRAVEEKSDIIKEFYRQYSRAVELLNADSDRYREMLVTKGGFPEGIKDSFEFPVYSRPVLPAVETVDQVINWMLEKELLKNSLSYSEMVTTEFID